MKGQIIHDSPSAFPVKATFHSCLYFIRGFGNLSLPPPKALFQGKISRWDIQISGSLSAGSFLSPAVFLFLGLKEADGSYGGRKDHERTQGWVISSQNKWISVWGSLRQTFLKGLETVEGIYCEKWRPSWLICGQIVPRAFLGHSGPPPHLPHTFWGPPGFLYSNSD